MRFLKLRVHLKTTEPVQMPYYKGGVIRGGFGLAFRNVSCPFPARLCQDCLLRSQCVWSYVFDTPRPKESKILSRSENVPHPFVIEPPDDERTLLKKGDALDFALILIGKSLNYLPYFIYAFEKLAEQGLGRPRTKFQLHGVYQNNRLIYDPKKSAIVQEIKPETLSLQRTDEKAKEVKVNFLTPTRIIYQGKISRRPQFHILTRSLLRRLWLLSYFHDQPMEIDHKNLIAQAEKVRLKDALLAGDEWSHFSRRQQRLIQREGVTGWLIYQGEIAPFLPYLRAGEILHIGKGTSFGMGKIKLEVK
ncbi:MAG: CRISPR system precrRNA processing endoribonuclease RAMP protein Cas6 [candidate division WOR-3 bacterium]